VIGYSFVMKKVYWLWVAGGLAAGSWSPPGHAAEFDTRGVLSFDLAAAHTESFENYPPAGEAGGSSALAVDSDTALHGAKVLRANLRDSGLPLSLSVPPGEAAYALSFWIQGDCAGGLAVDYGDGRPGALAQAYPTGRVTSDGWVEMATAAIPVDGDGPELDLRMYLSGYNGDTLLIVDVDAVELVSRGDAPPLPACEGVDLAGACGEEQLCLGRRCHAAAGWFPPHPDAADRARLVDYWKEKIRDTYGPYLPRKLSMPEALDTLDLARHATSGVAFWTRFAEGIRRLRDAHTYTRGPIRPSRFGKPMNACFFEGAADASQDAWPSDPTYRDVMVSHTGEEWTWGLSPGDRLAAVDGVHPIAWARSLMSRSLWYWESDEPLQFANVATLLSTLIPVHATTVTVVHCDAAQETCDGEPTVIAVQDVPSPEPGEEVSRIGCDNRPFYHVPGGPEDHRFGDSMADEDIVLEGWLSQSSPQEGLRGLVWNSLLGGWPGSQLDKKLRDAVDIWTSSATGVVQDHREGHGGTTQTADILVSFKQKPFLPMVSLTRDRERDEGPQTPEEGKALFEALKGYAGEYVGSGSAQTDIPVALLLTWDVSASDFLPYMLKGAPRTRLFGPGPTMGAFGTFYQYSYWGGLRWSIGSQDSLSQDGLTLCGRGVYPDEIVLPRQSDLLAGKDTIHEAAVSWLRSEISQ